MTTCHNEDFQILKTVANSLAQIGTMSQPIATMQNLLQQFVSLSRCFFNEESQDIPGDENSMRLQFFQPLDDISNVPQVQIRSWIDSPINQETLTATMGQTFEQSSVEMLHDPFQCHNYLRFGSDPTQAGSD